MIQARLIKSSTLDETRLWASRKLMAESQRNIEIFYLIKRRMPDFRMIAEFRKDNAKALKEVFKAFIKICVKLGGNPLHPLHAEKNE